MLRLKQVPSKATWERLTTQHFHPQISSSISRSGHFPKLSLSQPKLTSQSVVISAVLYVTMITLAKFSVLCFYRRVFGHSIFLGTSIIFVLQSIWCIICICLAVFRCNPIAGSWDLTVPSKCINFETIVLAAEPFNCALDLAMVALPVRIIRSLQLSRKHKIQVSAIFLLGGL